MTDEPSAASRYLDLLVETINGSVHGSQTFLAPVDSASRLRTRIAKALAAGGVTLAKLQTVPDSAYQEGRGWPSSRLNFGESMVGRRRLNNIRLAAETVLHEHVPGHLIETGVWRGGSCILMRGVLAAHGVLDRTVYVADSFQGLPVADESDDAASLHDDTTLAISEEHVRDAFCRYGLLDEQVTFLKGWFSDTLPGLKGTPWAVIRLDGDMYESTMDGIRNLYPDLSHGGFLIVDDYGTYTSCRRAIHEYRDMHGITDEIVDIDGMGVFWRKFGPARDTKNLDGSRITDLQPRHHRLP